jgi:hypothetical protein
MKAIFIILSFILLLSCGDNNLPRNILPMQKMEILLWEQMRANAFTKEFISKDSSKNLNEENYKIQQKIFATYKVDEESFYKSYNYYLEHNDLLGSILDSIIAKQTKLKQIEFERKVSSDKTINLVDPFKWQDIIKPNPPQNFRKLFNIPESFDTLNLLKKRDSVSLIKTIKLRSKIKGFQNLKATEM